jgi:hypothetical protein
MKILLEVNNNKAAFILDMLKQYSFVKAKPVAAEKARLKKEIKEAIDELKLVLEGKKEARNAEDVINEL